MGEKDISRSAAVRDCTETKIETGFRTLRAYRILGFVLLLRPLGNLSLAFGMKHLASTVALNPLIYLKAMLNPYVAGGITLLVMALLMRMALLSLADLSFVLPLTALGYIISTVLGKTLLHEHVSFVRWLGTFLIFAGTAIVGSAARGERENKVCENEIELTSA